MFLILLVKFYNNMHPHSTLNSQISTTE